MNSPVLAKGSACFVLSFRNTGSPSQGRLLKTRGLCGLGPEVRSWEVLTAPPEASAVRQLHNRLRERPSANRLGQSAGEAYRSDAAGFSRGLSWVPTRAQCKSLKGAYERRDAAAARNHTGSRNSLSHQPVRHGQAHRYTGGAWDQGRRSGSGPQRGDDRNLDHPRLGPRAKAVQGLNPE